MLEGKIIKLYRELQKMKQKDLGAGICSTTHISKIERGLTEVSDETILLLCQRLGIMMEEKVSEYKSVETLLKNWLDAIVRNQKKKAEEIKHQLDRMELLHIPDFYRTYTMVLTRFYLSISDEHLSQRLIDEMDAWTGLTKYEENMLLHIKGIFYQSLKHDYVRSVYFLGKINPEYYPNQEYYYDLARAYNFLNSRILAFFNASKALEFFTKTRNFSRIIDTEMLILIQQEQSEDFPFLKREYQRLIDMTEDYGLEQHRARLHHNLAYLHLMHGYYKEASEYYKKAMDARESSNPLYMGSLEGYLNALSKEGKTSKHKLLKLAEEGLSLSKRVPDRTFLHLFTLHNHSISEEEEKYYQYLETLAMPHFVKNGYGLTVEYYSVKLFDYYMDKNDHVTANKYAGLIISKIPRKNLFV